MSLTPPSPKKTITFSTPPKLTLTIPSPGLHLTPEAPKTPTTTPPKMKLTVPSPWSPTISAAAPTTPTSSTRCIPRPTVSSPRPLPFTPPPRPTTRRWRDHRPLPNESGGKHVITPTDGRFRFARDEDLYVLSPLHDQGEDEAVRVPIPTSGSEDNSSGRNEKCHDGNNEDEDPRTQKIKAIDRVISGSIAEEDTMDDIEAALAPLSVVDKKDPSSTDNTEARALDGSTHPAPPSSVNVYGLHVIKPMRAELIDIGPDGRKVERKPKSPVVEHKEEDTRNDKDKDLRTDGSA